MISIDDILKQVKLGNFKYAYDNKNIISNRMIKLLDTPDEEFKDNNNLNELISLITIGNIMYNYSDADILPIDDGMYDLMVAKLERIDYNKFTPGASPIDIKKLHSEYGAKIETNKKDPIRPFIVMTEEESRKFDESLFPEILTMKKPIDLNNYRERPFIVHGNKDDYITKRLRSISHNYPNLVGTLDKCKFVLDKQAIDVGAYNDTNVKIFERDFFRPLLDMGIINNVDPISMIGTLKYDGVSIEADVNTEVISARTRGDTDYNEASDVTPIFEGYKFPNAVELEKPIGMKFEAIVNKYDIQKLNRLYGTNYINGRTAIIGILGSSNAKELRDFITLVPLQCDFGPDVEQPDRLTEIQFLNKYYSTKEYLRYVTLYGNYTSILFQIKKYVDEAEFFKPWQTFMYDGVVVEFVDKQLIKLLGRKNSINQYQMAIKFNPLKRVTTFTGYTYTVGQNGVVTPMIHYDPIEFLGSIHTKSTGSSYNRFKELNLYIGDQIEVTYVNDVMPYVSKLNIDYNIKNHNRDPLPQEMFPTHCPKCGTKLIESEKGKTKYCPNMNCESRTLQRLSNMLDKLGIKDFSESAISTLGNKRFYELMQMTPDDFTVLGPTNRIKFYNELQKLKTNPLPDYRIIGALGFTNIAAKRWKSIFGVIPLNQLLSMYDAEKNMQVNITVSMRDALASLSDIGPVIADTICNEFSFFEDDIRYIVQNNMYIPTRLNTGTEKVYQIRFSGFRDPTLAEVLNKFPFIDCDVDAGLTKSTDILLVPYIGYSSSKVSKASKYGINIITVKDFLENANKYIPELSDSSLT